MFETFEQILLYFYRLHSQNEGEYYAWFVLSDLTLILCYAIS